MDNACGRVSSTWSLMLLVDALQALGRASEPRPSVGVYLAMSVGGLVLAGRFGSRDALVARIIVDIVADFGMIDEW